MVFYPVITDEHGVVRAEPRDDEARDFLAAQPVTVQRGIDAANAALRGGEVDEYQLCEVSAPAGTWSLFTEFIMRAAGIAT